MLMVAIQASLTIISSSIQNWCCHVPPTPTLDLELTVLPGSSLNTPSTTQSFARLLYFALQVYLSLLIIQDPALSCLLQKSPWLPKPQDTSELLGHLPVLFTMCLCSSWPRRYQGGKGLDTLRTHSHNVQNGLEPPSVNNTLGCSHLFGSILKINK